LTVDWRIDDAVKEANMNDAHLSLRAALAEDRLEDFVKEAETSGAELDRGSEFERGLALLLLQRWRERNRASDD
jgi:hypothetical protein